MDVLSGVHYACCLTLPAAGIAGTEWSRSLPDSNTLQVRKDNLAEYRIANRDIPIVQPGEILCRVDRFALTANNITYGVVGEKIGYWQFFPAPEGWGVIPVWGFADVIESRHAEIGVGERLYGYFPMGNHLVLQPQSVKPDRLMDGTLHRAKLPPVYNSYSRTAGEPHFDRAMEDERCLLLPLYATSYCIYDYLADNDWFGAEQLVVLSASSKTGLGLAMACRQDDSAPRLIALTSRKNLNWVTELGLYHQALAYDQLAQIDASVPTVIVDMSGNGKLLSDLHSHLGDQMRFCSNVGITHYDETGMGPGFIPGFIRERSAMFFAPAHIQQRASDWGPGVFQQKAFQFWQLAAKQSRPWLRRMEFNGVPGMVDAFRQTLAGEVQPSCGVIVALN
jgi:hypothetical protein